MQKLRNCLWFDGNAVKAAEMYVRLFGGNSKIVAVTHYDEATSKAAGMPVGDVLTVDLLLAGLPFLILNGGPMFQPTPAVSYAVHCDDDAEIERLYAALSKDGLVLMELQKYELIPGEKYAWVNDEYGVSWQLIHNKGMCGTRQKIVPCLLFTRTQAGRASEAINFYTKVFSDGTILKIEKYAAGEDQPEGHVKHAVFTISDTDMVAMDNESGHNFGFTPGNSFIIMCDSQDMVDRYWDALTADGGQAGHCGWLTDKFGNSWQVVPEVIIDLMVHGDKEKYKNVNAAMMQMKKLDIAALQKAYTG